MSMRLQRADWLRALPFMGLLLIWNVLCWRLPFFWDNILNAKIAHWYLESGFEGLVVPEALDAGHPPFFSLYLALVWKVFGASLTASHLAMLPFLLGVQWLSYLLARRFLSHAMVPLALLIPFVEPALLAQSAQISPDIPLLFFYLLSLVAILEKQRGLLLLALLGMGAVSFRGILGFGAVFLADVTLAWLDGHRRPNWRKLWPYVGAMLAALIWLSLHQQVAGWLLTPPETTYGGHRKWAGLSGTLRNAVVVTWRVLDHGRVFLFVWIAYALWRLRKRGGLTRTHGRLLAMALIPILSLSLLFIPFSNPVGHRYFLPAYLLLGLLALRLMGDVFESKQRIVLGALLGLGLVSGHFWVYPDAIAKGWDSTLAHLPYHAMRKSAVDFIEQQQIARHDVCTDFPVLAAEKFIDPAQEGSNAFLPKSAGLRDCMYVLYSNVSNGFSEAELQQLEDPGLWKPIFRQGNWPVRVVFYQRQLP